MVLVFLVWFFKQPIPYSPLQKILRLKIQPQLLNALPDGSPLSRTERLGLW